MTAPLLKSYEFRREREASWHRLERLVSSVERGGLGALDDRERIELPMLYRGALSSLSVARAISLDRALLEYLEALCQRAYFCVYTTRLDLRRTIADFFLRRFPQTVRRFGVHILLATAVLVLAAVAGYVLTLSEPDRFYTFVSPDLAAGRDPGASTEYLRQGLYGREEAEDALTTFATFLFTHNAKVGMFCFALGFVGGVPVIILLLLNGLMLGAFAAVFASRGLGWDFWGWVLPHGVTELLAVLLCAGAGLALAHALVFPGRYRRLESLGRQGREAGVLVVGAVLMFFVAGLLEGFFRQLVTSITVRYAVILATTLFWIVYLGWGGRQRGAAMMAQKTRRVEKHLTRVRRGTPHPIVTPEGAALDFVIASPGDRLGAFLIDFLLQNLVIVMIVVLLLIAGQPFGGSSDWLLAFVILAVFLVQNFYFVFFEARGNGTTPGKRRIGIRVMDAHGGPLTTNAVLVRNLMRNLEIYLPMSALFAPESLWPGAPGWVRLLAMVWMFVLTGMPFFNRRRLRVGDMVAGTLVAVAPRPALLPDLGAQLAGPRAVRQTTYAFTEAQLSVYGIYELQVLEDVLRGEVRSEERIRTLAAVAERIVKKIEWGRKVPAREAAGFLKEFYAALRAHLERKMLFGKRKKDKFSPD